MKITQRQKSEFIAIEKQMIKHKPENWFFHWEIESPTTEHWQQLLSAIPYAEIAKYFQDNPAVFHIIKDRANKC